MIETTIILEQDRDKWRQGVSMDSLIRALDAAIQIPGLTNSWTMPIRTRIDMLSTGIRTPVGIKIMGDNLDSLARVGVDVEGLVNGLPGVASVYAERVVGGVMDVQNVIKTALGGMNVTWTVEGQARYPVNLRYPRERRDDLSDIRRVRVSTPGGYTVPLGEVAEVRITDGPPMIKTENARKTLWVYVDTRESDIGGFVSGLQNAVNEQIQLPAGYSLVWSGQFEYMERASKRLRIVVPITLLIIFFLLFLHFRNVCSSCTSAT
jgi:Cu(I)/Ag(I) efflux system membrane protein CusA/SilA